MSAPVIPTTAKPVVRIEGLGLMLAALSAVLGMASVAKTRAGQVMSARSLATVSMVVMILALIAFTVTTFVMFRGCSPVGEEVHVCN